ncbi:3-oxoacyl-ACP synthase [Candidatus Poribacteria bacterium]|nr:MAG: 3-oxoacyl-ACP synthase [Candidatus Poribacteria bacterium]
MWLSKTRFSEIENLPEDTIDTSDLPELEDDFWENAQRIVPENYLQIEHEVLEWFKEQGQDYHDQINTVLRAYMESHR